MGACLGALGARAEYFSVRAAGLGRARGSSGSTRRSPSTRERQSGDEDCRGGSSNRVGLERGVSTTKRRRTLGIGGEDKLLLSVDPKRRHLVEATGVSSNSSCAPRVLAFSSLVLSCMPRVHHCTCLSLVVSAVLVGCGCARCVQSGQAGSCRCVGCCLAPGLTRPFHLTLTQKDRCVALRPWSFACPTVQAVSCPTHAHTHTGLHYTAGSWREAACVMRAARRHKKPKTRRTPQAAAPLFFLGDDPPAASVERGRLRASGTPFGYPVEGVVLAAGVGPQRRVHCLFVVTGLLP